MPNHVISPDTQATLLLCARFGSSSSKTDAKPLTLREYNNLAIWLKDNDLTPQDLLLLEIQNKLRQLKINSLEPHRILALINRGVALSLAVEKWTNQGLWILGRGDANYPKRLKQKLKYQAPAIIYGVGNKRLLSSGGLAIVGSRDIDSAGLEYTQKLAQTCAQQKIQVISGGAKGVDQASMLGTLDAGGTVVGVMADNLAKAAVAKKYRTGIKEGRLTLISTYDPNAGFNVGNAMGRNKYIYALADYGLVVNTTVNQGGTWAGATEALRKITDVPVFVRIEKNKNQGNDKLLEKGAIPFPEAPWNLPLTVLIADQISNLKNNQKSKLLVEQSSLFDFSNAHESNSQTDTIAPLNPKMTNHASATKTNGSLTFIQRKPQDIYEAVLPLILQNLKQPKDDKSLATSLDVQVGQMRAWLKKAVAEGKIKKNQKPVTYEINETEKLLPLNK